MKYLYYVLLAVLSYLIGNISPARIISRAKNDDITTHGSGNPGTANVWRTYGFMVGMLTLTLDAVKGAIPALIGKFGFVHLGCNPAIAVYVAVLFVVVGNVFPVFYKFKGGKGIATGIGAIMVSHWYVALPAIMLTILFIFITKCAAVCTLSCAVLVIVAEIILCNPADWPVYILAVMTLALVLFAHRKNLARLFKGKENKLDLVESVKKDLDATQTENIGDKKD